MVPRMFEYDSVSASAYDALPNTITINVTPVNQQPGFIAGRQKAQAG